MTSPDTPHGILALVTARGGSKRVPGKNIRPLGGRPLITWSIDAALGQPGICDVLVSTDSADIADVARAAGALVPWLRPGELSTDVSTSIDVALHALDWYEAHHHPVEGLLLLQPTSPFRSRETVAQGLNLFRQHQGRPVLGVSPAKAHPLWCFSLEGDHLRPFLDGQGETLRSQDLPRAYVVNGAFYLNAPADLRRHRSFYLPAPVPLVMDSPRESLDIDTEWEWRLADLSLQLAQEDEVP